MNNIININKTTNPINQTTSCPSSTTSKYKFISTEDIVNKAMSLGFVVESEKVARVRKPEREGFQRHAVTLTRPEWALANGDKLRISIINSHDGTGSLKLIVGYFRLVCSNGLMVSNGHFTRTVTHRGDALANLELALVDLFGVAYDLVAMVDRFKSIQLDDQTVKSLTRDMMATRIQDMGTVEQIFNVYPKRFADRTNDLWTAFNRIQEQIIEGGAAYDNGQKTVRLRKLTSVKSQVETNQKLWDVLIKYAA